MNNQKMKLWNDSPRDTAWFQTLKREKQNSGAELTAVVCRSCAFKSQADQDAKG